ncbi:type II secretion system F family protein [Frigidibacter sp. ROC022]|uniref:type II secretion system F family protein n=1 Tax=Frigidibacter sp. ROC022 TaxID=2971796 RepID=UPI00215B4F10|nr:type II secretion system F family protein [Frigidibacter sp. ROC022]MCR8723648.1 type II secretion system F family protein [Frigidibacter sp. ROC022]
METLKGIFAPFNAMLTDTLGPFGPLVLAGVAGFFLILLTLPVLLKKQKDPLERLREQRIPSAKAKGGKEKSLRAETKKDKLEKYATFLEPQDEAQYSAIKLKLVQAGYRSKNAVRHYHFAQFALGILLLIAGVAYAVLQGATNDEPMTPTKMMLVILGPGIAGYMLPKYWVTKRQQTRQEEITNGFPDALDMMLVCVEAGQSLDQSIIRVAKEIRAGFPALADEFDIVSYEVKAGKDKISVLRDMSERAGVVDVASFVTVLIQSASFGTSIAEALRVYAAEMRDKRVMRAEEKANTLPTKMTLATMMLTVPPLLIILIGPSLYDIYQTLNNAKF